MNGILALLGGAVAVAGADKLIGNRGYKQLFRHLGWSDGAMRAAAAAEAAGGVLMIPSATRRLGGAVVAGVSTAVMVSELRHGDTKMAVPRGIVLAGGVLALLLGGRR